MRLAGLAARIRNVIFLLKNAECKRHSKFLDVHGKIILKLMLKTWKDIDWTHLLQTWNCVPYS
jgi:hypothetical protein